MISLHMETIALVALAFTLFVTSVITAETIRKDEVPVRSSGFKISDAFLSIFNPGKKSPRFFWLVGSSFLVFLGVTGLSFFELYYFKDVLGSSDPARLVAISGIIVLAFSALGTAFFGYLSDVYGRWKFLFIASLIGGISTALIPLTKSFDIFVILGTFIAVAYGMYFSISKALATDLSPSEDAGKYMAYFNLAIGGSSALSPLFYGIILNHFGTFYRTGFAYLFEVAASFYFISLFLLWLVPRK